MPELSPSKSSGPKPQVQAQRMPLAISSTSSPAFLLRVWAQRPGPSGGKFSVQRTQLHVSEAWLSEAIQFLLVFAANAAEVLLPVLIFLN